MSCYAHLILLEPFSAKAAQSRSVEHVVSAGAQGGMQQDSQCHHNTDDLLLFLLIHCHLGLLRPLLAAAPNTREQQIPS